MNTEKIAFTIENRDTFDKIYDEINKFHRKEDIKNAILGYEKGFQLALQLHNFPNDLKRYTHIENHFMNDPNFDQSWWDNMIQIQFFSGYAACLCEIKDLDKAKEVATITEHFLSKVDENIRPYRNNFYNLAGVYHACKEFDKAIANYQNSIFKYELDIGGDTKLLAMAFIRKGICHYIIGQNELSKECFDLAEPIAKLCAIGKNALLYYFLTKFHKNDEKLYKKYQKMYVSRLKTADETYLNEEFNNHHIPQNDREQILNDFFEIK